MRDSLQNKTVWITGASAGIGAGMARSAAAQGANLILSSRRREALEAVAATCVGSPSVSVLPLDLTQPASFATAVAGAGDVDVLVNNGGISQRSFALDTEAAVTRRILETNFFGQVELTRLVAPGMIRRKGGWIVVTSSVVGYFGTPLRSSYAASKHALHGYFDSLRYELGGTGVGVTIVCPGYIRTDISVNAVTGEAGRRSGQMDAGQAAGMSPEEFADRAWRGILKRRPELHIGGTKEVGGIMLKRYAPRVFDWVIRRSSSTG